MLHVISLGAGVQSTTMALMAACGELMPMPNAAVFADTQDEPDAVYTHLKWLKTMLPFPVHITTAGKLSQRFLDGYGDAEMPFFIAGGGMQTRRCTESYKIRPIRRKIREILGVGPRQNIPKDSVIQWIGISSDEADRQKPSRVRFITNRFPLLEDATRMSRAQCRNWLLDRYGRVAPKSACKQCPYQSQERLLKLKESSPREFAELCEFDAAIRTPENVKRFHRKVYIHRLRVPLIQIDFAGIVKEKNLQRDLFTDECEGMCGV